MENFSAHVTQEVIGTRMNAQVRVGTFAPRTMNSFQVLDLPIF
jgi:hypothetical protein